MVETLPPWPLMKKKVRKPWRASEVTTSWMTAMSVEGRKVIEPAKAMWCWAMPTESVGATMAPAASPTPSAMTSAQIASVPMIPLGPCCSVEPIGTMIPFEPSR